MRSVAALLDVVARHLEHGRPGSRFPLLQLLRRLAPLSPAECEALVREATRLKALLAPLPVALLADPSAPALGAPRDAPPPAPTGELFPRLNGNGAPKTLADAFAWPLFVVDHLARLGAASGRGARFETGDVDAFRAVRTPLAPHAAAPALAG
jgi:hypothetical protein